MYTKEEREGILWEFHRSGLSAPAACRSLPLFPNKDNLYAWLKLEEAGELTAREMPDRAERMHCSHGEGSPAFAARRAGAAPASPRKRRAEGGAGRMKGTGRGGAGGEPPMQTDWRDWGLEGLPNDPAERAREAEVRLAEALAVLDVLKAPGPGSLTNEEKHRAGEAARRLSPAVRLADVTRTLSIPKSTYLDQASRISRPDPKAALRERVRASFEASGGAYGPESVTAGLRRGPGEPVSWRALAPGDAETPVVASEKVVRRIMREEGLVARKAAQMRRRARYRSYRGELAERPANVPLRGDGTHDFHAAAPGLLVVTDVTEFRLDGYRAYLSPAIDCFDGWPICWRVSVHADSDLMVGMLRDLVGIVGPTEERPLTVHTDGGAVYMGREWREACGPGVVRSMSRRARSPDNARAEGFFGTLKCDFFEGRDWTGVPFDEFSRLLGEYIEWYRDGKLKKDLGWKTIREYREERYHAA